MDRTTQASLSFNISQSLLKLMSTESVMLSTCLILCCPLLLLPSILPSIRVFSNESVLCIRWPKYWNFSISTSNEYSGLISLRIDWLDLLAVQAIVKSLLQHQSSNNYLASADCFQNSMLTNIQKGKCSCSRDGSDFSIFRLSGNTHRNMATLEAKLPSSSTVGPGLPVLQY